LVEGGTNLAAVEAMTNMTIYQTRFLEWLQMSVSSCSILSGVMKCKRKAVSQQTPLKQTNQNYLYSSTKACGSSFILGRPTIVGKMGHGESMIVEGTHGFVLLMIFVFAGM
jgi:hypothetical protein